MKTRIASRYVYYLTTVLLVPLVGCTVPAVPTLAPTRSLASPTLPLVTVVPSPTPSSELPTDTLTSSSVPPTRTPRPTPVPTMTANEEYALIFEMLQGNGGCRLPCWWGFTPGETAWQTVETFFVPLGKKIWKYSDSKVTSYGVYFDIPQHLAINQNFIVSDNTIDMISVSVVPPVRDDEFVYDDPQFAHDVAPYVLSQMLVAYGQPVQILLGVARSTPWLPFDLLLFYPEKGILMQYSGPAERREGKTFRVCPHQVEITLNLWLPEHSTALEDIPGGVGGYTYAVDEMSNLHSLEEATGMRIEQFYQVFVQPDNKTCLETPTDMW